ncbi:NAD(P)/FAD-dependent oxidoreductase [Marinobacter sp. SS21]|uniref:NAD(P)/FAD-dependent oxidoreductase n=1 Tax=Marinobacter sp. SS21 TaxID=2979460 RepID=UPI002331001F|nr:NAD(P)/FAD-dependent oxidoreductase [Marinobacter sp. SS21]MDC0661702.1 NAD(P)/FAD-dependent oxidoreductase [Marinobacter sp. SS21]
MSGEETLTVETAVIGGGVIGLAVARALALQGRQVVVLEREATFGEGVSSRNSEVIHAGIYYPKGSIKAATCVRGRELLYPFCQQRGVPHRKCGKWIIAVTPQQIDVLERIQAQAAGNGVALAFAGRNDVSNALPGVDAAAALYSPETGIVDSHQLMLAMLADLESAGGTLICRAPVASVESSVDDGAGQHTLVVGGAVPCRVRANCVVNAAGLGAVPLAQHWQGYPADACPTPYYARGVYFSYSGRHPFRQLVYPVPEPGGLGIHLTLDLAGQLRFGPDVEWIAQPDYRVDKARAEAFASAVRQWWPALDVARLQPGYAGVRPKLAGPGEPDADFVIQGPASHGVPGLVQLFGIESPGLTASLAIAEEVVRALP